MALRGQAPVPPWLDSMEIQPEDVRVPSDDSSPTQAPPDDPETLDPTLLLSIPRSENQYNEDFNDYTRQVHNSTHGDWPVSEPIEEWKCLRFHAQRFWFYRAWFHHRTYLGITMTSQSSNLPLDISSMITPLLIGPTPFHAFGAPGVGNLCFLLL